MACGRMMVGGVLLCACMVSAFLLAQSAPTFSSKSSSDEAFETADELSLTAHEKPLVRTKRAEEIMYGGNHQNTRRVKKSVPSAVATHDDTETDANELPPEETDRKDDAEQSLPEEKHSDEQEEYGGASNEQNNLEEVPIETVEGISDDEDSEHQETERRKRSAEALMTAESMGSSAAARFLSPSAADRIRPLRAKRDLDYEQLRELLLENSRQAEEEEEEAEENDEVGPSVLQETNREGEEEEEEEEEEEGNFGNDIEDGAVSLVLPPYPYDPRVSSEKEELIRELLAEKDKEEAKEKLIDYLLAAALTDAESTANEDDDGRFLVDAPVPLDDDDDAYIGPVAAAAAVKRSALYPYSYDEPHGRRRGAPVSGPRRSRLGEYERLNRLAEALGAYNDYEEE